MKPMAVAVIVGVQPGADGAHPVAVHGQPEWIGVALSRDLIPLRIGTALGRAVAIAVGEDQHHQFPLCSHPLGAHGA